MSGPEATSPDAAAPQYTVDQLHDLHDNDKLAAEYIDPIESADRIMIAAEIQKGLKEGVFEYMPGDNTPMDSHFEMREIRGRTPEVTRDILAPLRAKQVEVMASEKLDALKTEAESMQDSADRVLFVDSVLKRGVAREQLDIRVVDKPRSTPGPARPGTPTRSNTVRTAQVEFFSTAESQSSYLAFQALKAEYVTTPADIHDFNKVLLEVAAAKQSLIDGQKEARNEHQRAQNRADRAAGEARAKIEQMSAEQELTERAYDFVKSSHRDVWKHYQAEIKKAGTDEAKRVGVDQRFDHLAKAMLDHTEHPRSESEIGDDAYELNVRDLVNTTPAERDADHAADRARTKQQREALRTFKAGSADARQAEIDQAHTTALREDKTAAEMAAADARYTARLDAATTLERPGLQQQRHETMAQLRHDQAANAPAVLTDAEYQAAQAAESGSNSVVRDALPDKAKQPAAYEAALDRLHQDAFDTDPDAARQNEVYERHQRVIDSLGNAINAETRQHLIDRRDKEVAAVRGEQVAQKNTKTDNYSQAILTREEALDAANKHESWHRRITGGDEQGEAKAAALRQELKLEPMPFLESRSGGLLHWSGRKRGPKVIESYFKQEGPTANGHLMVVERRMRRTGELISQTTMTTEQPLRRRVPLIARERVILPPGESNDVVQSVRASDNAVARRKAHFSDYFSGFRVNAAFDGDNGVYARNLPEAHTDAERTANQQYLDNHRARKLRRGGITYWLSGNRI